MRTTLAEVSGTILGSFQTHSAFCERYSASARPSDRTIFPVWESLVLDQRSRSLYFPNARAVIKSNPSASDMSSIRHRMMLTPEMLILRSTSPRKAAFRSEEHTSELQSHVNLVCR